MKWIQFYNKQEKKARYLAKGKAELKPQHFRKLEKIWEQKFYKKYGYSLNKIFEVIYSRQLESLYYSSHPFLPLIKHDHNFNGNLIELKLDKDSTKLIP